MKTTLFFVGTVLLGGLATWLPSIVLHAVRGDNFSGMGALTLMGLLPTMAIVAVLAAQQLRGVATGGAFAPLAVLLGMWILGPLAMFVSATAGGGGFATQDWWVALPVLTALFPLTTFMMATYDGSLGGLLLGSAALILQFVWSLARSSRGRVGPNGSRASQ